MTMLLNILWGAGALVIAGYMVAALLRPERF
ncbi:K+-transporting ATPase KdpF subunit [Brevundimonas nasdae]|nr:potassium-transporting ATPase subunit F [Brevundimonas sp.]MBK6023437.1 potassium-transporting ATPase subunit F [Brevundimonas nasdae]MDQ0450084.1 K+-transporting ATPase KdpF subunit [Brevundimonas nasdae]